MKTDISKVTRKGQVTIPVRLRKAFGLEEAIRNRSRE
jgi:bifunctional DNA-binding transcriptional regulator/antitoxin component of YhaV-PrlF toxin-antitoxin module